MTPEPSEPSEPIIVAFANQKGGAAKSTNAVHTAGALAQRGNTLFVDLDKHGGVTNAYGYADAYYLDGNDGEETLFSSLMTALDSPDVSDLIIERDEFDLLPATEHFMNQSNINQLAESVKSHERLGMLLDQLEGYDYIVIDTPPDLNILSNNAIVTADGVLMPFIPEKLNQNSLVILRKQLQGLGKAYPVNPIGMIASRVGDNAEHEAAVDAVDDRFPFPTIVVRKTIQLSKAIDNGQTIFSYEVENKQADRARDTFYKIANLVHLEVDK